MPELILSEIDIILPSFLIAVDAAATLVFALSGALVAARKEMDIVGFCWLSIVTGVGGGTLRDLLIDAPVFWVIAPTPIAICLSVGIIVHFLHDRIASRYHYILIADAFGMALVAIAGASKSLSMGMSPMIAVTMGVITATVGGIIRDVLGQEPSVIMRKEIYVTAALAGSTAFVVTNPYLAPPYPSAIGIAVAATIRLCAIKFQWTMPTYRPRPGRDIEN